MKPISRREFVAAAALAASSLGLPATLRAQSAGAPKIGVQLYSVRDDCAKDFDKALEGIAKMGFEGVEFAGYFGYADKPRELRMKIDGCGLKGFSTHIATAKLRGDELKKTIEFHQILGCKYLIVATDSDCANPDKCQAFADFFNATAETLRPLGMACGYHNHSREFEKTGGKTYFELFADRTAKEVVLEQDCGWSASAHQDPAALMKRWPGRFKLQHFKPTVVDNEPGKKAYFGQDSVDWTAALAAARTAGGTEWVVLEQETYPEGKPAMECVRISLDGLKKIW